MAGNIIAGAVTVLIIGAAVIYIIREKRKGVKCIGCPAGSSCSGNCGKTECSCDCHTNAEEKK